MLEVENQKRIDKMVRQGQINNIDIPWDAMLLHMHRLNENVIGTHRNKGLFENSLSNKKSKILKSRKKQQYDLRKAYIAQQAWQLEQLRITAEKKKQPTENKNPNLFKFHGSTRGKSYKTTLKKQTPPWAKTYEHNQIIKIAYRWAKTLTRKTKIKYNVDHDIPLRGDNVSGLHVYENLRIMPAEKNFKKSNLFNAY